VSRAGETLNPERVTLVVVDLQEKLLPAMRQSERVLKATCTLLELARVLDLPVVLTTQYRKGLGPLVPAVSELASGVEPVDKVEFGCFGSDAFRTRLSALRGRDQLLVAGIESHICVTQTVLGALEAGYSAHVVSDAVDSRTEDNWRLGLKRMERAGALVSSVEMAAYELLARADSAAFKQMLPHFK
jgi:nicotinamidase-related amidase